MLQEWLLARRQACKAAASTSLRVLCSEMTRQFLRLQVSALARSRALPFLQVRRKALRGSQGLRCPGSTARRHCHPSCTHGSFGVQRQSCKRLVIPQGTLRVYALSPARAAGDVYRAPVSAELRKQQCDYNTRALGNAFWLLVSPRLISTTACQCYKKKNKTKTKPNPKHHPDPNHLRCGPRSISSIPLLPRHCSP